MLTFNKDSLGQLDFFLCHPDFLALLCFSWTLTPTFINHSLLSVHHSDKAHSRMCIELVFEGGNYQSWRDSGNTRRHTHSGWDRRTHLLWAMRSMSMRVTVCARAQRASGSRNVSFGVAPQRDFCMTAAETVESGKLEGGKGAVKYLRKRGVDGRVKSFEEIPHTGRNGWVNLAKFWRDDSFKHLHMHMERTFNALGPIYRYREEWLFTNCSSEW